MKIGVFCSSRLGTDAAFAEAAEAFGAWIAEQGHELVYGGEKYGLMEALADSVRKRNGRAVGVVPNIPMMLEHVHPDLNEYIYVRDMAERKQVMLRLADAFAALPGGPGTLDEFSEVLCLNKIGELDKPLVLLNIGGYYEPFRQFLDRMTETRLADPSDPDQFLIADTTEEAAAFLTRTARK